MIRYTNLWTISLLLLQLLSNYDCVDSASDVDTSSYEDSLNDWNIHKILNNNCYTYTSSFQSWIGFGSTTTIKVEDGIVVKRSYQATDDLGSVTDSYDETKPDEIGTNSKGKPAVTMDELYQECDEHLALASPEDTVYFDTFDGGIYNNILKVCGYVPNNCMDDCFMGIKINSLVFCGDEEDPDATPSPTTAQCSNIDKCFTTEQGESYMEYCGDGYYLYQVWNATECYPCYPNCEGGDSDKLIASYIESHNTCCGPGTIMPSVIPTAVAISFSSETRSGECCDQLWAPSSNGIQCIEGETCCPSGKWVCNGGFDINLGLFATCDGEIISARDNPCKDEEGLPPVAQSDFYLKMQNEPVTIDVLANDIDPDQIGLSGAESLIIKEFTNGNKGSVELDQTESHSKLKYSPNLDECGDDEFTYTIQDNDQGFTDIGTVHIGIICVPPVPPVLTQPKPQDGNDGVSSHEDNGECCDPSAAPSSNGIACFEGESCCPNGEWVCNSGVDINLGLYATCDGKRISARDNPCDDPYHLYETSLNEWNTLKRENDNCYTYKVATSSWTGYRTTTTIKVEDGNVVRRSYEAFDGRPRPVLPVEITDIGSIPTDPVPVESYDETEPHEIGTNTAGAEPLTMDELYLECYDDLEMANPADTIHFTTFEDNNILRTCGYVPFRCMDDCFRGTRLAEFAFCDDEEEEELPPIANPDFVITTMNSPTLIDVLENDKDPDQSGLSGQDTLIITEVTNGNKGSVELMDNQLIGYTPNLDECGSDQFTYIIQDDDQGFTAIGTVHVFITCPMNS